MTAVRVPSKISDLAAEALKAQPGWDTQIRKQLAAAAAGTGVAKIVSIGDSIFAGQSSGTIDDHLVYGCMGRLDTYLTSKYGCYAEGYSIASVNPYDATYNTSGLGSGINSVVSAPSPSCPVQILTTYGQVDGGLGAVWTPTTNGVDAFAITAPVHAVTAAKPLKVEILTVDFNTQSWKYNIDGGAYTTVTCGGGNGGTSTLGAGQIRRTTINLDGLSAHTIRLFSIGANSLFLIGWNVYYDIKGIGFYRNSIPGWRAVDFASGGGATAGCGSQLAGNSMTPDHIKPWSGLNDSYQTGNALTGFPFAPDLMMIHLGGNDCATGVSLDATKKAIARMIRAARRGTPASGTPTSNIGASVLIIAGAYPSSYSDNFGAVSSGTGGQTGSAYEYLKYKRALAELAFDMECGFVDMGKVTGETAIARGLGTANQIHPTQNGHGTGSGDGHNLYAQIIEQILTGSYL